MRIPFAFVGASSGAAFPANLNLSGWWPASFGGLPWAGVASAGDSLANDIVVGSSSPPTVGTAQNGYDPANFVAASSNYAYGSVDATALFAAAAGSIFIVFKGTSADAPVSVEADATIVRDNEGNILLTYTTSGVTAWAWDGATQSVYSAAAPGEYHVAMMRWNGSVLGIRVDGNDEVTTPCGDVFLGGDMLLGVAYNGTTFLDAEVLEMMFSPEDQSANYDDLRDYFIDLYDLAPDAIDPMTVSGLKLWYDASAVTVVGGSVTAIPDQSGNARNATVSGTLTYTATNAAYNNGPTINRADATDLIHMPNMGLTTGPFTVVLVGDAVAAGYNYMMTDNGFDLRAQAGMWRISANGGITLLDSAAMTVTNPTVIVAVVNGASSKLYASSRTPVTGTAGTAADMTAVGFYVGDVNTAGGSGDINFRHALVYDGAMAQSDAAGILQWFGNESAIAIAP